MKYSQNTRNEGLGSHPHLPSNPSEIPSDAEPEFVGSFGLTQKEVDRLREIIRRECGVELTNSQAWARAVELVALARALGEAEI